MKTVSVFLCFLFSLSLSASEVVVLVPGFFNSFTPEYFSPTVVSAFTKKGYAVYIAKDLNPIGTIEENGARLEKLLHSVEHTEKRKINFNIVGHSAGGFYALWVAHTKKFNIKTLSTLSTPYLGIEFVQTWLDKSYLFSALAELAYLDGLNQLTAGGVSTFLKSVRVSPATLITAFGGSQSERLDITDARNISVPLLVTSHYISGKNDGIVGLNSALGLGAIKTYDELPAKQLISKLLAIQLEHWEQVLEPSAFVILGIRNTSFNRKEQRRFYTALADYISKQK